MAPGSYFNLEQQVLHNWERYEEWDSQKFMVLKLLLNLEYVKLLKPL